MFLDWKYYDGNGGGEEIPFTIATKKIYPGIILNDIHVKTSFSKLSNFM